MEDSAIIDLYWAREERALSETDTKYGGYCRSIAHNILRNREDTEECVSDTWLHAWNAMPPQRPSILSSFLGRITRNLSFDRCRRQNAEKRGGGSLPLALDEMTGGQMDKLLHEYCDAFAFKRASRADFEQFFTDRSGLDITPLMRDYLDTYGY